MISKDEILSEIKRTAEGGVALGRQRFEKETGITSGYWLGKYWSNWGEAVAEANLKQRQYQGSYSEEELAHALAHLSLFGTGRKRKSCVLSACF